MTTISLADYRLPTIVLSDEDHRVLLRLAMAGTGFTADDADGLLSELERATVVPDDAIPPDVVRMGSLVQYSVGDERRTVELVYPKDANISQGKVSVLTPIGTALIGLRAGQTITWRTRDGRRQALTVDSVSMPAPEAPEDPEPPSAA